jgi:hypothetical protein
MIMTRMHKFIVTLLSLRYFPLFLWHKYKYWRWEQKCIKHLGIKPTKVYVSTEAYDKLRDLINNPSSSDTERKNRFNQILNRRAPWDN